MIQINNGFDKRYFISEDNCIVCDCINNVNLKPDRHYYKLKTELGRYKTISQKSLYRLCFNKEFCEDNIELLPDESFKEIHNTNGLYFVSNKGRVKSIQGYNAIILKTVNVKGYPRVDIIQDGQRKTKLISRLVAAEWLPMPERIDFQLHHKDGNKENNTVDNLVWLDPAEHKKLHSKLRREKEDGKEQ